MDDLSGGTLVMDDPETIIVQRSSEEIDVSRANRTVVWHHLGEIVAIMIPDSRLI